MEYIFKMLKVLESVLMKMGLNYYFYFSLNNFSLYFKKSNSTNLEIRVYCILDVVENVKNCCIVYSHLKEL